MPVNMPHLPKPGDTVALVGPASPMKDKKEVAGCIAFVASLGFRVKAYPSSHLHEDYLAGSDKQRAGDINRAFADPKIKAIFTIRGGYGSSRLLPLIDWKTAAKSRKLFTSFSDLTSLMNGLITHSQLSALHAPTPSYFLNDKPGNDLSRAALLQLLTKPAKATSYRELCGKAFKPVIVRKGRAKGLLVGGNLSLFAGLCGTPWMPKAKDIILFIEDIHEKPYKLDRFLTQIINSGYFRNVRGVAVGGLDDCTPTPPDRLDGLAVITKCLTPLKIPVLAGLPIGHGRPSFPFFLGRHAELDAVKGDLVVG